MFTGLISATGRVVSSLPSPAGRRLVIDPGAWNHHPGVGDSISVSGVCLTVASPPDPTLTFDVIPETLQKTTLGSWQPGHRVNLEHAATAATFLGGHIVQGHVDGVGEVLANTSAPDGWRLRVRPDASLLEYLVPKGSIAVDGVSLTLATIDPAGAWFEIGLIPTTLEATTLGSLRPGSRVNLECDTISKTVVHWLRHFAGRRSE